MTRRILASAVGVLAAGAASAADLPRRAEPPMIAPPPSFTWTGVYIGTHTAYTFSDTQRITSTGNDPFGAAVIAAGIVPGSVPARQDGFANIGGGFGLNYQLTPGSGFVIGGAFDADWTDLRRSGVIVGNPIPFAFFGAPPGLQLINTYSQGLGYLATANGRLGYAFDRLLVYATGGVAIGKVEYAATGFLPNGIPAFAGAGGGTEIGYNFGGGIEYAIPADNLLGRLNLLSLLGVNWTGTTTLKVEYIHYDLGSRDVIVANTFPLPAPVFATSSTARFRTEGNMIRAGFTYKFGG